MAGSTSRGNCPVFLLLAGLIGLSATPASGQDTIYIGGSGGSVEVNLDVLDQLGAPPTVAGMLRADIRRGTALADAPLPLPGETRAVVSRGAPMPPPTRPTISRTSRSLASGPITQPRTSAPRQPALPSARSTAGTPAPAIVTPSVPAPARVAAPIPNAPAAARSAAPIVAPAAKVMIPAPAPKAPETKTRIPDIEIPNAPKAATRTKAVVPPPPPAITAPAVAAPAAKAPEPAKRVAAAAPAPKAAAPAPKASAGSAISIAFGTDAKSLPANAEGTLDDVAQKMKADTAMRVQLLAYASAGERSEAKARRLSLSRALEVRSYLIGKGVASTRMDVRALGNQAPDGAPDRVDLTLISR
ncbi:OmpA family protein [Nisaea sp.]|uniref:OmpA family protein n=1 Tax=Nisaea sp. TaxID=2024842 RepID=UPI0032ED11C9